MSLRFVFLGANNDDKQRLKFKEEFEKIRGSFWELEGKRYWDPTVQFEHQDFARTEDLQRVILRDDPFGIHFVCHGHDSALSLFNGDVEVQSLVKGFAAWSGPGKNKLRLIIANACHSSQLAQSLSEHVDFVIANRKLVMDDCAIKFATSLYEGLGAGRSLLESFEISRMHAPEYFMTGRKNAATFRLKIECQRQAAVAHSESSTHPVVKFLRKNGFKETLRVKFHLDDDVRVRELHCKVSIADLLSTAKDEYGPGVCIKYKDSEGDLVTINTEKGLEVALKDHFSSGADVWHLYVERSPSKHVSGSRYVGDGAEVAASDEKSTSHVHLNEKTTSHVHLEKEDLTNVQAEICLGEIKDLFLSEDLQKLKWLKTLPKKKELELLRQVTANHMSPDSSDSETSLASKSSTHFAHSADQSDNSDVDSDSEDNRKILVAARNLGDSKNFHENVKNLLKDFMSETSGAWTFCTLIWSSFLRSATFPKMTAHLWKLYCTESSGQDAKCREQTLLQQMDDFFLCGILSAHPQLDAIIKKVDDYERRRKSSWKVPVAAIAVVDCVVQHLLSGDESRLLKWQVDVIKGWYDSSDESPNEFLTRANEYLQEETKEIKVLQVPSPTNSYVVFMVMNSLVSSLLFQHLQLTKFQNLYSTSADGRLLLYGFRLFVTSAGRVLNLDDANMPARSDVLTVVEGLKCLTQLPEVEWEMLGPFQAASEFVEIKPDKTLATGSKYLLPDENLRMCIKILDTLLESKDVAEIERLSLGVEDIKGRMDGGRYKGDAKEFHDDVVSMFDDAEHFYQDHTFIRPRVASLKVGFQKRWEKSTAELKDREKTLKRMFHEDCAERDLIWGYISHVQNLVEKYVDSTSGDQLRVEDESIALALFKNESFADVFNYSQNVNQDFICPISKRVMRDPVMCSDGKTYERAHIEMWFDKGRTSPMTREELEFEQTAEGKKLRYTPNEDILKQIDEFKDKKLAELQDLKSRAEGEEERRLFCNRYGYAWDDRASKEERKRTRFDAAEDFLENYWLKGNPVTHLACLTGPPASGKTVTMQQIVYAVVNTCREDMEKRQRIPFLPLFIRGAELTMLLSNSEMKEKKVEKFRHLVELYLDECVRREELHRDAENLILNLFDKDRILIFIDGLDEAAAHQELVEVSIENFIADAHTSHRHLRVLLSTREHSYVHSRACLRLLDFDIVSLQPLDSDRQRNMIENRVSSEKVEACLKQLETASAHNSELATSPYLLSLMIEVYNSEGKIPPNRVELYSKQVEGIVLRCIRRRIEGITIPDTHCCIGEVSDEAALVFAIMNIRIGEFADEKAALLLAIEFLEVLAFLCQMRDFTRDFTLTSCTFERFQGWQHGSELFGLVQKLLFKTPVVGLITCVAHDQYRFSHLTLQEYLAARCSLRLHGNVPKGLLELFSIQKTMTAAEPLHPLHSHWKREVLKFTACMLEPEAVFEDFCIMLLAEEDGTGIFCEIVQDFLTERGKSERLDKMLCDKVREIRHDQLIVGLCHPSLELRTRVLSEMRKFLAFDPVEGGIISKLEAIAADAKCAWNKRVAAILSLSQIAQMEDSQVSCRRRILEWILRKLAQAQSESVASDAEMVALVKGLGIILRRNSIAVGAELASSNETNIELCDDSLLISVLEHTTSLERIAVAISNVRIVSDGLLDFLLGNPAVISKGTWPMKHLRLISDKYAKCHDTRVCNRLSEALIRRLHALSFLEEDRQQLLDSLGPMLNILPANEVSSLLLDRLKFGKSLQRVRVLEAAGDLKIQFVDDFADQLAQRLSLQPEEEADKKGGSLSSLHAHAPQSLERAGRSISSTLLSPTALNVAAALTFNVISDVRVGAHSDTETIDKSLLTYIMKERPTLVQYLLDTLCESADGLEHRDAVRQSAVAKLNQFQLKFTENRTITQCVYDIIARVEHENESKTVSRPIKGTKKILKTFSSWWCLGILITAPSVVYWHSHNCRARIARLPPPITLQALEYFFERIIERNDPMEVLNPIKDVAPKLRYISAMLWESEGLTHDGFASDIPAQLSLTPLDVIDAKNLYRSLQLFKDPWIKELDRNCGHLLLDARESDVTFTIGKGKTVEKFPAHWFVLASRNAYFDSLFQEESRSSKTGQDIALHEISSGALKVLFRFLYIDDLPEHEDGGEGLGPGEMLQVADRFKAAGLYDHCQKLFVQGLTVGNAIDRLVLLHDRRLEQTQKFVMEFLQHNSRTFQREAMETLDILKRRPDLINCAIKVTNALCSGLATSTEGLVGSYSSSLLVTGTWIPDFKSNDRVWVWHICNALKLNILGRFVFSIVLQHIRDSFLENPTTASNYLQPLAAGILNWKPRNKEQEVERQFLLKELCMGNRAMQMPAWTEIISLPRKTRDYDHAFGGMLNQVDAFFSNPANHSEFFLSRLDLKTESVLMETVFQDPACGWSCNINLTAMISDFHTSILSVKQRNVRVFHLGGHAGEGVSFLWNADQRATNASEFNDDSIALLLGAVAGKNGPLECAVLNACSTFRTGQLLRKRGMPHVVCWPRGVEDSISQEFTEKFYRALVRNSTLSTRNYKSAFMIAVGDMQKSQLLKKNQQNFRKKVCVCASCCEVQCICMPSASERGKTFSPDLSENVVQFLSEDGDSAKMWLCGTSREIQ